MTAFNWLCPFCGKHSTITEQSIVNGNTTFTMNASTPKFVISNRFTLCPNPECAEVTIDIEKFDVIVTNVGIRRGQKTDEWRLRPFGAAKQFPACVPEVLQRDYREACLISTLSPKASATLSRRVLQGMIRDFWNVTIERPTLWAEIKAIEDKVDPETWAAIKAVKDIGNIGAHMQQDINVIVDVDPSEARLLIELTETLFEEWYIARENRKAKMAAIVQAAAGKMSG
ncbi:DUF4145 domain-containing protein [Paraburkholderia sp. A3BS-1L]|uniref:DUF4145 domain-containing protein n=1 Tax=Paraburkholderia sp. A3BS-1L TaxID=3028375 RepID=UPI003DA7AED5